MWILPIDTSVTAHQKWTSPRCFKCKILHFKHPWTFRTSLLKVKLRDPEKKKLHLLVLVHIKTEFTEIKRIGHKIPVQHGTNALFSTHTLILYFSGFFFSSSHDDIHDFTNLNTIYTASRPEAITWKTKEAVKFRNIHKK